MCELRATHYEIKNFLVIRLGTTGCKWKIGDDGFAVDKLWRWDQRTARALFAG